MINYTKFYLIIIIIITGIICIAYIFSNTLYNIQIISPDKYLLKDYNIVKTYYSLDSLPERGRLYELNKGHNITQLGFVDKKLCKCGGVIGKININNVSKELHLEKHNDNIMVLY